MKKNVKVIEIKAHMNNGHVRTVQAVTPLAKTPAGICKETNIPVLSVFSVKETEPMAEKEAMNYALRCHAALVSDPFTVVIRSTCTVYAA